MYMLMFETIWFSIPLSLILITLRQIKRKLISFDLIVDKIKDKLSWIIMIITKKIIHERDCFNINLFKGIIK